MKDSNKFGIGVKTNIYNHKMRKLRLAKGLTQRQLADVANITSMTVSDIETFKKYPRFEKLEDIAEILESTVEELFPEWLREQKLKASTYENVIMVEKISLEEARNEARQIEAPKEIEKFTELHFLKKELEKVMSEHLSEREQKVLRLRFGLTTGKTMDLEEVGQEFGVTRERIRMIESKALRKLKENSDSDRLKEFLK